MSPNPGDRSARLVASLGAGAAHGLCIAGADLSGRLLVAAWEGIPGFDLALASLVGFLLALAALIGLPAGAAAALAGRRLPGGWAGLVAPAALAQLVLLVFQATGLLVAAVSVAAAGVLAAGLTRVLRRAPWLAAVSPLLLALAVAGAGAGHAAGSRRPPAADAVPGPVADASAPDLLLVTLDTTRADRLGAYGCAAARTPHLDALAAGGLLYERCYAPSPSTQPSHASLLTGLQVPWHGMRINGTAALDPNARPVAAALSRAGYATRAVVASFVLDRQFGLGRGFGSYDDYLPAGFGPASVQRRMMRIVLRPSLGMAAARTLGLVALLAKDLELARDAEEVTAAALAILSEAPRERPLFLWVHYWDPHAPYDPPPGFVAPWRPEADAPPDGYRYWFGTLSSRAEIQARYDGEIAYVDTQLGRLIEAFRRRGRPSIVAVTADHGEGLQQHGEPTHGGELYDATLRVPLILAGDGIPAGRRLEAPVAAFDLAPTLLELAGLAPPEGLQARSLLPFTTEAPACEAGRALYHEAAKTGLAAWRHAGFKLILGPERTELYALRRDAAEAADLALAEPERVGSLRRALELFRAGFPVRRGTALTGEGGVAAKLAELGYVDEP